MKVYIAEKPKLGRAIATVLAERSPITERNQLFVSGRDWVVCWAAGHIFENEEPDYYVGRKHPNAAKNAKGGYRWSLDNYPIQPGKDGWPDWSVKLDREKSDLFKTIKRFVSEATTVVNAGDADREGQRLVDEILEVLKYKKPVQRVMPTANDETTVRKALQNERPNAEFIGMSQAALARSHADWYCGMNLSPVLTLTAQKSGFRGVLPYGRVQTPVLGLVVKRDQLIENFKPRDFFSLTAQFQVHGGQFKAKWKPHANQSGLDADGRLLDRGVAAALQQAVKGQTGKITNYEDKEKTEGPWLTFSIDKLQVLGIKKYGMSADEVLKTVQALYDAGLVTYPRSDSGYLPTAQHADAPRILATVQSNLGLAHDLCEKIDPKRRSLAWNDTKVTAHHGIIPTGERVDPTSLPAKQGAIYREIALRYAAQFLPLRRYRAVSAMVEVAGQNFTATGTTTIDPGWRSLYQKAGQGAELEEGSDQVDGPQDTAVLPPMKLGEAAQCLGLDIKPDKTKPPPHYTEDTLLEAMVGIHKLVEDEKVKAIFKKMFENKKDGDEGACGLGTGATRHTFVPKLVKSGLLTEEKVKKVVYFISSPAARAFINALPDDLAKPDMTALWEAALGEIEAGNNSYDRFMANLMGWVDVKIKGILEQGLVVPNVPNQSETSPSKKAHGTGKAKVRAASASAKSSSVPGSKACSKCSKPMVLRTSASGPFYGCSGYPACKHTEKAADAA